MTKDCCEKEQKKIDSGKFTVDPFILVVAAITLVVLVGTIYFGGKAGKATQVSADSNVELSVESTNHSWGTIEYDGGTVAKTFSIGNTGTEIVRLYDVVTSCMCTTAQLITPEKSSGKFGMHSSSSEIYELKPGESAELKIEFDPAYHGPSGVGQVTRTVVVKTNAAKHPQLTFQLSALVVKN